MRDLGLLFLVDFVVPTEVVENLVIRRLVPIAIFGQPRLISSRT